MMSKGIDQVELGQAMGAARLALAEFAQQDDYLLAHGASLMSDDSHEILHLDTLRRIVAAAVAAERERCAKLCEDARDAVWPYHARVVVDAACTVCENLAHRIRGVWA